MAERNRLIIGSGTHRRDGWKTLDGNPRHEPDYVAVIPPLPDDVKAVAWDEIEWVHGITSLYPWEAERVVRELRAVLCPSGKLSLEQPDFRNAKQSIPWLFGDPSLKDPLHMNKFAYTPDSLSELLCASGFSRVDVVRAVHHLPERDFRIEAFA